MRNDKNENGAFVTENIPQLEEGAHYSQRSFLEQSKHLLTSMVDSSLDKIDKFLRIPGKIDIFFTALEDRTNVERKFFGLGGAVFGLGLLITCSLQLMANIREDPRQDWQIPFDCHMHFREEADWPLQAYLNTLNIDREPQGGRTVRLCQNGDRTNDDKAYFATLFNIDKNVPIYSAVKIK